MPRYQIEPRESGTAAERIGEDDRDREARCHRRENVYGELEPRFLGTVRAKSWAEMSPGILRSSLDAYLEDGKPSDEQRAAAETLRGLLP